MLAISYRDLCVRKELTSLDIIERCLGAEPENGNDIEFLFSEIAEFFLPYRVFKIDNSRFQLVYYEDINRLICYLLADKPGPLISEAGKNRIKNLVLLESSRSVSGSILNGLSSSLIEYSFLQLYQCIEYLFKLNFSFSIMEKHDISLEKSVEIVLSHEFKIAESDNLYFVIKENVPLSILENLHDILPATAGDDSDIHKRMANYIYKLRCNVAHLRYTQEELKNVNWSKCIDVLLEMIFAIYQCRNENIIHACICKETWKPLSVES